MKLNQKGDTSIAILFGLLIGGLLLLQLVPKSPSVQENVDTQCVSSPDSSITVTLSESGTDTIYELIRANTPVFYGEVIYLGQDSGHFVKLSQKVNVAGQMKDGYKPVFDRGQSSGWSPSDGVDNLLFVDMGDGQKNGFFNYGVYLKKGSAIPTFIKNFCEANLPINPKTIMPDSSGGSFPPLSFTTDKINKDYSGVTICPPGVTNGSDNKCFFDLQQNPPIKYNIFSYEAKGSPTFGLSTGFPGGTMTVSSNGITKTYKVHFVSWSAIKYIALVDTDSSSSDSQVAYKYVPDEYDAPFKTVSGASSGGVDSSLQMKTFSAGSLPSWGWWSPECKPAIYLYPEKETRINVKVDPAGFLTYTDPEYPSGGWQVIAYPDGKISTNGKDYNYLYYESKINDLEIDKPTEGFVVPFNDLSKFYSNLLPSLGLNAKETKDFKDYWEKYLPKSNYYFVGLMDDRSIEKIEPLTVNPKPDSIIRIRFYFEALDEKISVKEPSIITPVRSGYTLVEWGGLVKVDKSHPFTCSQ